MPLRIKRENARRPPAVVGGIEPSPEDLAKHQRKNDDEIRGNVNEIADSISIDLRDEIVVTSRGDGEEVAVTHDLGFIPERWKQVGKKGAGDIWESPSTQWNERTVYFVTSADEGVEFTVALGRKPKRRDS